MEPLYPPNKKICAPPKEKSKALQGQRGRPRRSVWAEPPSAARPRAALLHQKTRAMYAGLYPRGGGGDGAAGRDSAKRKSLARTARKFRKHGSPSPNRGQRPRFRIAERISKTDRLNLRLSGRALRVSYENPWAILARRRENTKW